MDVTFIWIDVTSTWMDLRFVWMDVEDLFRWCEVHVDEARLYVDAS
jgi:hypothetical protein